MVQIPKDHFIIFNIKGEGTPLELKWGVDERGICKTEGMNFSSHNSKNTYEYPSDLNFNINIGNYYNPCWVGSWLCCDKTKYERNVGVIIKIHCHDLTNQQISQ